jgi:hypothetical protein
MFAKLTRRQIVPSKDRDRKVRDFHCCPEVGLAQQSKGTHYEESLA